MQFTGVVRFTVSVKGEGDNMNEGLADAKERMSIAMAKFKEFVEAEGMHIYDIEAPRIVCY